MPAIAGAEGEGMRRLTREHCDVLVRVPMLGTVESLKVSVSAEIVLRTRRQRQAAALIGLTLAGQIP